MKRSLKNIERYRISGSDGTEGTVNDFLFDEEKWIIRYIEAGFKEIERPRILIPISTIKDIDWQQEMIKLNTNEGKIESSPDFDSHAPVSREYEKELIRHYDNDPYWQYNHLLPMDAHYYFPPRPIRVPDKDFHEEDLDTNLRSFKEVSGYRINGTDSKIGQVEDIIVDDGDWQIIYLIVDTSVWLPWSKKVVLSIDYLKSISFMKSEVNIELNADQIKHAPEFDPSHPIDMDYEKALNGYFSQLKHEKS